MPTPKGPELMMLALRLGIRPVAKVPDVIFEASRFAIAAAATEDAGRVSVPPEIVSPFDAVRVPAVPMLPVTDMLLPKDAVPV